MKGKATNILFILIIIIAIWFFPAYYIYHHFAPQERGTIGDMFSPISSLFGGLALAGIIVTIYLQRRELALQRRELASTREIFQKQKFESTFFQLSSLQQQLINDIKHKFAIITRVTNQPEQRREYSYQGRDFFQFIESDFRSLYKFINDAIKDSNKAFSEAEYDTNLNRVLHDYSIDIMHFWIEEGKEPKLNFKDDLQVTLFLYNKIFTKVQFKLAHYFRHLYSILKFIEFSENAEVDALKVKNESDSKTIEKRYKQYADFLQAQLSPSELFLLFYNGLKFPNMKRLIEKYQFIENLPVELLLNSEHKKLYSVNIKSLE